jgi:quercetin dioxygenase-like cupin family protein
MKNRTRLLSGTVVATCALVGVALATPKYNLNFANSLATGTIGPRVVANARIELPAGTETNDAENNENGKSDDWNAMLFTSGPSTFFVQDVSYLPGGHTGWHSHPGILLSTVTEGSIEWYNSKCQKHVYSVGDSLTETPEPHYVRNVGSVNARFLVTYVIAKDQPSRIDQPAPACAADLGLN